MARAWRVKQLHLEFDLCPELIDTRRISRRGLPKVNVREVHDRIYQIDAIKGIESVRLHPDRKALRRFKYFGE